MDKTKIVFFGSPEFVSPVPEKLGDKFEVVLEIRSREDYESSKNRLAGLSLDLFVVAAFGKIIPEELLEIPRYGSLNIHPSILPKYRGPSPIQSAILNGDKNSGVTIIKMDPEMDHGPILAQKELPLEDDETFLSFARKAFKEGAEMLIDLIPNYISGKVTPATQDDGSASFCKIIKKENGYFEIDNPPDLKALDRIIRAYYPWPTAWTRWKGKVVKFYPGGMIGMEGKKVTDLKSFLNGYPDFPIKVI